MNTQESSLRGSRMDPPVATTGQMVPNTASEPRLEMVDDTQFMLTKPDGQKELGFLRHGSLNEALNFLRTTGPPVKPKSGDLPAAAAIRINQLYFEAAETNSQIEWSDAADFLQFITASILKTKPDEDDNHASKDHAKLCRVAEELDAAADLSHQLAREPGAAPIDWAKVVGVTDLDPYATLLALKHSPVDEDDQSRVLAAVRSVLASSLAKLDRSGSVVATAPGGASSSSTTAGGAATGGAAGGAMGPQSIESGPAAHAAFVQFQALAEWLLERIATSKLPPRLIDHPLPRALYAPPADEGAPDLDPALALGLDASSDVDQDTLRAVGGGTQSGEAAVVQGRPVDGGADAAQKDQAAVVKGHLVDTDPTASEDEQSVSSSGSEELVLGRNSPIRALTSSSAQSPAQDKQPHRVPKVRGARRSAPAQQPLQPDPSMAGGASMFAPIPISHADQAQQELQPLLPSQGYAGSAQTGSVTPTQQVRRQRHGGSGSGGQRARDVAQPQRRPYPYTGILPERATHRGKAGPPKAKKNTAPGPAPRHHPPQGGPRRHSDSSDMSDGADPWEAAGAGQRQQAQPSQPPRIPLQRQDAVVHSDTDIDSEPNQSGSRSRSRESTASGAADLSSGSIASGDQEE